MMANKKKYKAIKSYAYRNNNGATGGPAGILYLQQKHIGEFFREIPCKYYYRHTKFRDFFLQNYISAIFSFIFREIFDFNNYYICHDIASAFAAALLNRSYSLIFHQQGPIIEELTNFNTNFKFGQKTCLKLIEKLAFKRAKSVHFPSSGAREMYFNSPFATTTKEQIKLGTILPNTIEVFKDNSPLKKTNNSLVFLSVGTLTKAKGQDQTIKFLDCFLQKYTRKVEFILVGNGPLRSSVVKTARELEHKYPHFEFIYHNKLSHIEILQLNKKADIYIMLHRISIFDLATLEAMQASSAIVLSKVGGNIDFNKENNIFFIGDENEYDIYAEKLSKTDITSLKELNKNCFSNYFSPECFKKYYEDFLGIIINNE